MMASPNNSDSRHILHKIPPMSKGVEIGIWYGSTSANFLARGIESLEMIDPWSPEPYKKSDEYPSYEAYMEKYERLLGIKETDESFQEYYDKVYDNVKLKFGNDPRAKIHRMTSDEWFAQNTKQYDWIYVDGDHGYEGCKRDLDNALKCIRVGGMIMGDDYFWPGAGWGKEGVTRAVDDFIKENMLFKERHGQTQYIITV